MCACTHWQRVWLFHLFRQNQVCDHPETALAEIRADDQFLQMKNGSPIGGCSWRASANYGE
ncbi:hypothetical protein ACSS6W_001464 [Trichoderma asperelloides]